MSFWGGEGREAGRKGFAGEVEDIYPIDTLTTLSVSFKQRYVY